MVKRRSESEEVKAEEVKEEVKEEEVKEEVKEEAGIEKQVELSSLATLQPFNYQGHVFTKRKVSGTGIKALSQEGDKLITLPPDTLVMPI